MIYQIAGIGILIAFYSIYIGKMILLKRKGIVGNQIGKGNKNKRLLTIEILMKIATYSVVIIEVISIVMNSSVSSEVRIFGVILGIIGVIIFGVAVYNMRDSWRAGIPEDDKTSMITEGIYRFSRNPAFVGFDLVYIGILCIFFNIVLLVFTIFAIIMLHLQILEEERYLPILFGDEYMTYKNSVGRYIYKL